MTFCDPYRFIENGDLISLRHALDEGMSPNPTHRLSATFLMAAFVGNTDIGRLLIERGASVNLADNQGNTALWYAAHLGRVSFVRLLLENGASPECCPYAAHLESWLDTASGLPKIRIAAVMELIDAARSTNETQ
jgi:ankyrin repeat protein